MQFLKEPLQTLYMLCSACCHFHLYRVQWCGLCDTGLTLSQSHKNILWLWVLQDVWCRWGIRGRLEGSSSDPPWRRSTSSPQGCQWRLVKSADQQSLAALWRSRGALQSKPPAAVFFNKAPWWLLWIQGLKVLFQHCAWRSIRKYRWYMWCRLAHSTTSRLLYNLISKMRHKDHLTLAWVQGQAIYIQSDLASDYVNMSVTHLWRKIDQFG